MDKMAEMFGDHVGDIVGGMVKNALGVKGTSKDKGGLSSFFGGDKKNQDESDKGGIFSFGDDKRENDDDDKGSFFSRFLDRDDNDKKAKQSGFDGLFNELDGPDRQAGGGAGGSGCGAAGGAPGGPRGGAGLSEGDLFGDLMDVAEETSRGN
ncbi:calpain clp-1 [Syngnathus scovelli]|uniref:calpain clp-1 n=1 Tax=Syngnathus scovelli TaxID=161590 RepID=UPI0021108890|nr:uncharacterized protein LOC125978170 [Syngnathus scovelli]